MPTATSPDKLPVHWTMISNRWAWVMAGLGMATITLFFTSQPPSPSPFITSYLDLLNSRSRWAADQILEHQGSKFILSLLFIIVLTCLLAGIYYFTRGSTLERAEDRQNRTFALPLDWTGQKWRYYTAAVIFVVMLVSNVLLFVFYDRVLNDKEYVGGNLFLTVYTLALLSRLAGLILGVGTLIQYALADFAGRSMMFLSKYLRYFYPTLISLAVVGLVFSRVDQFDSLFIELVRDPLNFALFALLLFPASIVIVWFTPYYLFFTDYSYADRNKSWRLLHDTIPEVDNWKSRLRIYHWIGLHKRLIVREAEERRRKEQEGWTKEKKEEAERAIVPPPGYMPDRRGKHLPMSWSFNWWRIMLGILYIMSLVTVCMSIYIDNHRTPGDKAFWGVLILFVATASFWYWVSQTLNAARNDPDAAAVRPRGRTQVRAHSYLWPPWYYLLDDPDEDDDRPFFHVRNRIPFFFGVAALLGFMVTLFMVLLADHGTPDWQYAFRSFIVFLTFSLVVFVWLAVYRRFYRNFTFDPDRKKTVPQEEATAPSGWDIVMDRVDHLSVQAMLLVNPVLAALSLVLFLLCLLYPGFLPGGVSWLNPLNIYLLMVNGAIAGFMILDRYLLLREHVKQFRYFKTFEGERPEVYEKPASRSFFWGGAIIVAILAVNYLGNGYHEVTYRAQTQGQTPPPTLADYTEDFLLRYDSTKPILFVAADGGGLKACYWTMLNLKPPGQPRPPRTTSS